MNNNLDELFELKKAVIQYGFDSRNYSGVYYPGIHGFEINVNNATYPQAVIAYIHESLHYIAHEKNLGVFQLDYLFLYLELVYFSSIYKSKLIDEYLASQNIRNKEEKRKYIFVNSLEISEYLAKDQKYVEYLKFCISIYDIYFFTLINSTILNESIATYISLNVDSSYYIYNTLELNKFFYNTSVATEIKNQQKIEKYKIKSSKEKNVYTLAYEHTEKLIERYGFDTTIGLAQFVFDYIPVYELDLIGISLDERRRILKKYYNLDETWLNIANIKDTDIFKDSTYESFKQNAPLAISGYLIEQLPTVEIKIGANWASFLNKYIQSELIPESTIKAFKRIYFHPCVINAIECLKGSKTHILEIVQSLEFAQRLIYDPKSTKFYEFIIEKEAIISDDRINQFPELLQDSSGIYANKQIQQMVSTMDTIISINRKNRG